MGAPMAPGARRPYGKTLIFGAVVVSLYALVFTYEGLINETFTKGGLYAFLPIAAAFLFSFAHGNFTSNFWSSLGVEASKAKKEVK